MSAAFTPGPWKAHGNGWEVRACDDQMKVCDIRGWGYLTGGGAMNLPENEAVAVQKANEALIAAAPELYNGVNALLGLLQLLAANPDTPPALLRILTENHRIAEAERAAAKARGETL